MASSHLVRGRCFALLQKHGRREADTFVASIGGMRFGTFALARRNLKRKDAGLGVGRQLHSSVTDVRAVAVPAL